MLGSYVRDRGVLTLEEAIHKITAEPARRLGLTDRGTLAAGLAADLVVFDPATIANRATEADPAARPAGIERVMVNGAWAVARRRRDRGASRPVALAALVASLEIARLVDGSGGTSVRAGRERGSPRCR